MDFNKHLDIAPEVAAALGTGKDGRGPGVSQEKIVRELERIAFAGGEVRDGDKLRALEMLTKLLPSDDGSDGARTGVVILPEIMAEEARG